MPVPRITPEDARRKVQDGEALLVCAYPDPDKFTKNCLQGAISRQEFESRVASLPKNSEIIFYCA